MIWHTVKVLGGFIKGVVQRLLHWFDHLLRNYNQPLLKTQHQVILPVVFSLVMGNPWPSLFIFFFLSLSLSHFIPFSFQFSGTAVWACQLLSIGLLPPLPFLTRATAPAIRQTQTCLICTRSLTLSLSAISDSFFFLLLGGVIAIFPQINQTCLQHWDEQVCLALWRACLCVLHVSVSYFSLRPHGPLCPTSIQAINTPFMLWNLWRGGHLQSELCPHLFLRAWLKSVSS